MKPSPRRKFSMDENDWDLWAIVRSCYNVNRAIPDDDVRSCNNVNTTALIDHCVDQDGNSAANTNTPTLFPEQSDWFGDFSDSFPTENEHCFGLDEVCCLSKNANTNYTIEPHNPENKTETIPNSPLVVEHEEKKKNKKVRGSMQLSRTEEGKAFSYRGKSTERYEILAEKLSEADQWRWRKYGMKRTGSSPFLKSYYRCNEVENCPARRHVQQSSTDANKVVVTYRGQHIHHPPPNQHIAMVDTSQNANAPVQDPSFPSSTSTSLFN
ncbi:putative wrky transcription factor 65 [Nicotiana attenuata]|uniref:Wrky transcription factor 65 n=2 Tax=Nicotiana attenuata TaxID=49451 RepID=A0A1J6IJU5_NICAT|nr:putative wrky transcription factor 65 [Nicotiana attenuata]